MNTRICNECGKEKQFSQLCPSKTNKYGYAPRCKECKRIKQIEYRSQHIEQTRKLGRDRARRPEIRAWQIAYNKDMAKIGKFLFGGKREEVIKRDGEKCVECGITRLNHIEKFGKDLNVHHKDGNGINSKNKNNTFSNLETLCLCCHGFKDNERKLQAIGYVKPKPKKCISCGKMIPVPRYKITHNAWNKRRFCNMFCLHRYYGHKVKQLS